MKPVIGISVESEFKPDDMRRGSMTLGWNYAEEVVKAGGVPILIPPMADMGAIADLIDGWLLPGGADIDASYWNEENHPKSEPNDGTRVQAELALYRALSPDKPILGICYGCQFLNVAAGGTLEQHVPDRTGHGLHSGGTLDAAKVDKGSKLASITGATEIEGKSYHHQAVGKLGEGLTAVAHHEDGTIEAIESTNGRWIVGVQWHPERTPDSEPTQRLMRAFIEEAAAARTRRSQ